jgi:multidrug efflux pump subunit AcrA (membrane-fusion protein)
MPYIIGMAEQQELILGLVREQPLVVSDCRVIKPEGPNRAMAQVLKRAEAITEVNNEATQRQASTVAQELQGLRGGLAANYRSAKQPVTSFGRALDNVFHELDRPMELEYRRIEKLVSAYQDQIRRQAELAKAQQEAEQRERERQERARLAALERAKQEAELKARLAESARERREAERAASALTPAIEAQKIALAVETENAPITFEDPPPEKPPGGRVWTQYIVEMTDPVALAIEHPELVKIELRQEQAQAFAKNLDEAGKPMVCKGLIMKKVTRTSFTGAAAIRIDKE